MYVILLFVSLFFSHAAQVEILDPCTGEGNIRQEFEVSTSLSVGALTLKTLDLQEVPYQATEQSVTSIFNTPTGSDAFQIISKSEMRAYGWCYTYNNQELSVYPHEVFIEKESDHIVWFFAFAMYKEGEWLSMCEPAWTAVDNIACN